MGQGLVTVVVATYGRPDVLRCALATVQRQTVEAWRVLVVGDACPAAGGVVADLGDDRIRFVDLPRRQGEQSRPNSVGMLLATTPYLAYLNHDDLWLPDHLDHVVAALDGGADVCATAAAFTVGPSPAEGAPPRPVFHDRTTSGRQLRDAFAGANVGFEPASAWAFRRELVDRVGPWRPAAELHRTPWFDWLLRVWRSGATFHDDPTITVLKLNNRRRDPARDAPRRGAGNYAKPAYDHEALLELLASCSADQLRALVDDDLANASAWPDRAPLPRSIEPEPGGDRRDRRLVARLRGRRAPRRYHRTGEDLYDALAEHRALERGDTLRRALHKRTREPLPAPSDLDELVAACRGQLAR